MPWSSPLLFIGPLVPTGGHVWILYCNVYCFPETWPVWTRGHGTVQRISTSFSVSADNLTRVKWSTFSDSVTPQRRCPVTQHTASEQHMTSLVTDVEHILNVRLTDWPVSSWQDRARKERHNPPDLTKTSSHLYNNFLSADILACRPCPGNKSCWPCFSYR